MSTEDHQIDRDEDEILSAPQEIQTIGRYEVLRKIREGGFGAVYECHDPKLDRRVAVKTFKPFTGIGEDDELNPAEYEERFSREAKIAARLDHPNLTKVHDYGENEEGPYIVQEYLDGTDIDHLIGRKRDIPLAGKVRYLLQIAEGMAHAHSKGIIHRDIKPSNVKITPGGPDSIAKIMDFGLAKFVPVLPQNLLDPQMTHSGAFMGTPSYSAPEQWRKQQVSNKSDIFSFGILAYEFISLHHPFQAEDVPKSMDNICFAEAPPLSKYMGDACPARLERVIRKCMEKKPRHRYKSFGKVGRELESVIESMDITRPMPSKVRRMIQPGFLSRIAKAYLSGKLAAAAMPYWHRVILFVQVRSARKSSAIAAFIILSVVVSVIIVGSNDGGVPGTEVPDDGGVPGIEVPDDGGVPGIEVEKVDVDSEAGIVTLKFKVAAGLLLDEFYRITREPPWQEYPKQHFFEQGNIFSFEDDEDLVAGKEYNYIVEKLDRSKKILAASPSINLEFN